MEQKTHIDDYDYHLPSELIAQYPADRRENSRLLVVDRKKETIAHKHFYDIIDYLNPGDCLVMNNSKVIPARLFGIKESTGAKIEFLLIKRIEGDLWETMVRPGKKVKQGDIISFSNEVCFKAEVISSTEEGNRHVHFIYEGDFHHHLDEIGKMPLPPYIEREATETDKVRYQTVYSKEEGSVAAPTAGLHFTEALLEKAKEKGIKIAYVTLHVGIGTFRPVKSEYIQDHKMHFEAYWISQETADLINQTKAEGGKVISVGTTSTRTLESAVNETGHVMPGHGNTNIFIYEGYTFQVIDGLITNFHLPKSTLLMLISALYDREKILEIYHIAVKEQYHFFSYGDAMMIL